MPTQIINLGQVSAFFKGVNPPTNQTLIWYDDNPGVKKPKYYDTELSQWTLLSGSNITGNGIAMWNPSDAAAGNYDTNYFVSYLNKIWRSEINNNTSTPGSDVNWVEQGFQQYAGVTGNYTGTDKTYNLTLDTYGRISVVSHNSISIISSQVSDFNTAVDDRITLQKGVANGLATLDSGGKIPFTQLPSTLLIYKGTWDLSTNTPTLADGVGTTGWTYKVTGAPTPTNFNFGSGNISLTNGDYVIYNGTVWEKSDNSDLVNSVNGLQGIVQLNLGFASGILSITGGVGTIDLDSRYYTETEADARYIRNQSATPLSQSYHITGTGQYFGGTDAIDAIRIYNEIEGDFPDMVKIGSIYGNVDKVGYISIHNSSGGVRVRIDGDEGVYIPSLGDNSGDYLATWDSSSNYLGAISINDFISSYLTNYYTKGEIQDFFSGAESITGYNKSNWDTSYNNTIVSASFNTSDGVITLTQQDTGSVTVDIDGRYALSTSISGTTGKIAKFGSSSTVVDSIISESGSELILTGTAFVATDSVYLGYFGKSNLLVSGTSANDTAIFTPNNFNIGTGGSNLLRLQVTAGGQIITANATNTGEHFIIGGSARVNGELKIASGNNLSIIAGDIQFQSNAGFGILTADANRLLAIQNGLLTVNGNQNINGNLRLIGTTNSTYNRISNTSGDFYLGIDSSTASTFGNGNYSRVIYSAGAYPLDFWTNDLVRLRITSDGDFGFNIIDPDIYNNFNSDNRLLTLSSSVTDSYSVFTLSGGSGLGGGEIDFGNQTIRHAAIASLNGSILGFYVNTLNTGVGVSEAMRISSAKNILINTTTDDGVNKLQVNGGGMFTGNILLDGSSNILLDLDRGGLTDSNAVRYKTNGTLDWYVGSSPLGTSTSDYSIYSYGTSSVVFNISKSTGASTFVSSANSDWAATFTNNGTTLAHGVYINIGASSTGIPFRVDKNGSSLFNIANNGVATFVSSISATKGNFTGETGETLTIQGVTGEWTQRITGANSTGNSYGLLIAAGTNSSDFALNIFNQSISTSLFSVKGNGNILQNLTINTSTYGLDSLSSSKIANGLLFRLGGVSGFSNGFTSVVNATNDGFIYRMDDGRVLLNNPIDTSETAIIGGTLRVNGQVTTTSTSGYRLLSGSDVLFSIGYIGGTLFDRLTGTPFYIAENGSPQLTIASGGVLTLSSTLNVNGQIISLQGNNAVIFKSEQATSGYQYLNIQNTSGRVIFGVEGSVAGSLLTNGSTYATVLTTGTATNLEFGTNQILRLKIDGSTGDSTFSGRVIASVGVTLANNQHLLTGTYGTWSGDASGGFTVWGQNTYSFDGTTAKVLTSGGDGYGVFMQSYFYGLRYFATVGSVTAGDSITVTGTTNLQFAVTKAGAGYFASTLQIGSISNGVGDFLTVDGSGVITRRTAANLATDLGTAFVVNGVGSLQTASFRINGLGQFERSVTSTDTNVVLFKNTTNNTNTYGLAWQNSASSERHYIRANQTRLTLSSVGEVLMQSASGSQSIFLDDSTSIDITTDSLRLLNYGALSDAAITSQVAYLGIESDGSVKRYGIESVSTFKKTSISLSADHTMTPETVLLEINSISAAGWVITLPEDLGREGRFVVIKDTSGQAGIKPITIIVDNSGSIDNLTSILLDTDLGCILLYYSTTGAYYTVSQ